MLDDSHSQAVIADGRFAAALHARRGELPRLRLIVSLDDAAGDADYASVLERGSETPVHCDPADDALAVLHYTSGSSGVLKAAMLSFGNRKALIRKSIASPTRRAAGRRDGPRRSHHPCQRHADHAAAGGGACNLLLERYDDQLLLETIQRERVTRLFLVPAMINRLVNVPGVERFDLSSLRLVMYGAAPMAPALVKRAIALFGPILAQGYGAGETCSLVTVLTERDHLIEGDDHSRLASCGRCYFETDLRVVNEDFEDVRPGEIGEIVVKGPDIMQGYWQAPELTAEVMRDGYYLTGDLARVDERGYVFIVDRKKEMIISGGFNIYPTEVEQVLTPCPRCSRRRWSACPTSNGARRCARSSCSSPARASAPSRSSSTADAPGRLQEAARGGLRPGTAEEPQRQVVRRLIREAYWQNSERRI